mgnify:CR=1 FL=1
MSIDPDIDKGRRFIAANPPPGQLLLCGVTGSHHYGFPSPDSDIDLKGIHLAPIHAVLGLDKLAESHDKLQIFEGLECDLTTHEAKLALGLMLKGNGNMLERIFSPFQLVDTPDIPSLRALAEGSLSRMSFGHYAGYLRGMQREHLKDLGAKSLLYTWRVALTGIHLLTTGEVVAHLPTLAPRYGFADLSELIERKVKTREKEPLSPTESKRWTARWPELERMLANARDNSPLPSEAENRQSCNDWLVERRLQPD